MNNHHLCAPALLVTAALLAAACGSSSGSGSSSPSGSGQINGNVAGQAFGFGSGVAHVGKASGIDGIDIILSNREGLCDSFAQGKLHPGETIVQVYALTGTAPGAFRSAMNDVKYASISPTCPSGTNIEKQVGKAASAKTYEVTLSSVTSTAVDGKLTVTFDDGSSVTGSFSLPICAATAPESSVCY